MLRADENRLRFSLGFDTERLRFSSVALGQGASGATLSVNVNPLESGRFGMQLSLPPDWSGDVLTVASANLPIWPGYSTAVSAINGSVPGSTIRVRRGQEFAVGVQNRLRQPLVLHWHGALAIERMDDQGVPSAATHIESTSSTDRPTATNGSSCSAPPEGTDFGDIRARRA